MFCIAMLHKNPKPAYRRYIRTGATILFVAEAIAFAGSYFCWYRMNTSRGCTCPGISLGPLKVITALEAYLEEKVRKNKIYLFGPGKGRLMVIEQNLAAN